MRLVVPKAGTIIILVIVSAFTLGKDPKRTVLWGKWTCRGE